MTTYAFVQEPIKHGCQYAYNIRGCRCDKCREWRRNKKRAYVIRKRAA